MSRIFIRLSKPFENFSKFRHSGFPCSLKHWQRHSCDEYSMAESLSEINWGGIKDHKRPGNVRKMMFNKVLLQK